MLMPSDEAPCAKLTHDDRLRVGEGEDVHAREERIYEGPCEDEDGRLVGR